jgi:hypothetical protein
MIIINFDKAKEITKNKLRVEREPLLTALDIQFQRALETNADTSDIIDEKNRLRNITSVVDECSSLDELKELRC